MTRLAIADPSNDLTTRTRRRQRLLVIDDDPSVSIIARDLFSPDPIDVLSAETAAAGCEILRERRPDVVILDHYLPDGDGLEVFQQIRQFDSRLPVIWITARGTSDTAIEATKLGAFDFLTKPIDLDKLREQVHQAIQSRQLMLVPVEIADHATTSDSEADKLIGRCPAMQEVYKAIGHIAAHDVPALLVGEAGTGKELVARAIYQHGARATKPFLKLRCSDFSAAQLEAELFGQTANDSLESAPRPGKLELAAGGTLLLEEISAIEPALQGKLLRLIHEHKYEPVGSTESRSSDAILIFTSQHDPEVLVKSQRLRSDLYYLLSAFIVRLPSLRERREDLSLLVENFIHRVAYIQKSFGAWVVRVSN
ncbi:MAG TPA: sigma-54 dependent transcriptional regulator, partial [Pirellulaceae bacterium]|nr:sigma-54 dependent transcriptional regulator [Pirellulaceae bacterium]